MIQGIILDGKRLRGLAIGLVQESAEFGKKQNSFRLTPHMTPLNETNVSIIARQGLTSIRSGGYGKKGSGTDCSADLRLRFGRWSGHGHRQAVASRQNGA
jgi:hypothetical protein